MLWVLFIISNLLWYSLYRIYKLS